MADESTNPLATTLGAPLNLTTSHQESHVPLKLMTPPDLILMVDIETLALGTRPVITQAALLGYDLQEDELLDTRHVQFYPVEPQQQIIPPRVISASTIAWWMKQSDEARDRFEQSTSTDFGDLTALIQHLIMTVNQLTNNGLANYEIVAKGPQFDIAALETLITELGFKVPWDYSRVRDLRTYAAAAGIDMRSVPQPAGFIPHVAFWDAKWQIDCYLAAKKALASR